MLIVSSATTWFVLFFSSFLFFMLLKFGMVNGGVYRYDVTYSAHVVMMTFILYGTPPLCAAQVIGGSILFVRECEGGLYIMKYTFIIRWATAFKRAREKNGMLKRTTTSRGIG